MLTNYDKLIIEISKEGRRAYDLPACDVDEVALDSIIPSGFLSDRELGLPEASEIDVVRHYTNLSNKNFGVDTGFYPLGSCTMKYNPKINEDMAALPGFTNIHPYQPEETAQGALELMYGLDKMLAEVAGMSRMTLQPAAGAHGELTGIMVIKAYHRKRKDFKRTKIIVPDAAHGTNPATAAVAGFDIIEIKSHKDGSVDLDALKAVLGDDIAGLMLTNPSTLGLFERNIKEVAELVHDSGGLLYYDGANINAIMGMARPGDMGFDVCHYNLHKTMSTPHGGGGPGSGAVGVVEHLVPFLPSPMIEKDGDKYYLDYDRPDSIGRVVDFYGNFDVLVKAYSYIYTLGPKLREASQRAVLNANYIAASLKDRYDLPIDRICMHECVFNALKKGVADDIATLDIAKRLLDYGFHPPTIYFPLIVPEAMMVEPTETEGKETLDAFIEALRKIADEAEENPDILKKAPYDTIVRRIDEKKAAKDLIIKWQDAW